MTSQNKLHFNVNGGPSKLDLMFSLFDSNSTLHRTVDFQLDGVKKPISVGITLVQQEDGSGESWNFRGSHRHFDLSGYFSTKHRKGHLTFVVPLYNIVGFGGKEVQIIEPDGQFALEEYIDSLRKK
jgi:hypothetical protein